MGFSPRNVSDLMALINTIAAMWQQSLKMKGCVDKEPFTLQDQIESVLKNNEYRLKRQFPKVFTKS